MIGDKVGEWEIVGETRWNGFKAWQCRCKCGYERAFRTIYWNTGKLKCCQECRNKIIKEAEDKLVIEQLGKVYGTYTVDQYLGTNKYGTRRWLCKCRCGHERIFNGSQLYGSHEWKANRCMNCFLENLELSNRLTSEIPERFWQRFLDHAKRRGKIVTVTKDDLYNLYYLQQKKCKLTGIDLYFSRLRTNFNRYTNASLDRIDSSKPYEVDNIQWVDKRVNMMKQQLNQDEFIELCHSVSRNTKHDESTMQ